MVAIVVMPVTTRLIVHALPELEVLTVLKVCTVIFTVKQSLSLLRLDGLQLTHYSSC